MATTLPHPAALAPRVTAPRRTPIARALRTLASRRAALTAHNPRQIAVPMLTPILFALVIAPALKSALGGLHSHIDYTAFVAVGTVGLLVPLATTFAGLSVIVDRDSGAQRELLAAPIPRALLVLGNLIVVLALSALQIVVVIAAAALRGAHFHISASGVAWFVAASVLFVVLMYAIAETLAARIRRQEEYIGATPAIAILPWFFAGALFPISVLPGALATFAKFLPLTHAMALLRYGFVDPSGTGLHDIWGLSSTTTEAWLSLAVVALFTVTLSTIAIRAFKRSAVS
jgi:ABC-2 type transport system permease protein